MRQALLITIGVTLILLGVLVFVARPDRWPQPENPPRQGEALEPAALKNTPATHSPESLSRLIREPQNTWSNLAFVLCGAFLFSLCTTRIARLSGVTSIAVGVGSFLYHASASRTLRHLDVGAMYWLFFVAAVLAFAAHLPRFQRKIEAHTSALFIGTLSLAVAATCGKNLKIGGIKPIALELVTGIATALLIAGLVLVALLQMKWRTTMNASLAIVLFGLAVACQIGDRPGGWLCDPTAAIQAHALWHIFSAAALLIAVKVLDSSAVQTHKSFVT